MVDRTEAARFVSEQLAMKSLVETPHFLIFAEDDVTAIFDLWPEPLVLWGFRPSDFNALIPHVIDCDNMSLTESLSVWLSPVAQQHLRNRRGLSEVGVAQGSLTLLAPASTPRIAFEYLEVHAVTGRASMDAEWEDEVKTLLAIRPLFRLLIIPLRLVEYEFYLLTCGDQYMNHLERFVAELREKQVWVGKLS